jgi:hypothetical protein
VQTLLACGAATAVLGAVMLNAIAVAEHCCCCCMTTSEWSREQLEEVSKGIGAGYVCFWGGASVDKVCCLRIHPLQSLCTDTAQMQWHQL